MIRQNLREIISPWLLYLKYFLLAPVVFSEALLPSSYLYGQENKSTAGTSIIILDRDVNMANYLPYMDSISHAIDSLVEYSLNEYVLVRHNSIILERLKATDYDSLMANNRFIFDQNKLIILWQGDTLQIPSREEANEIRKKQSTTHIDINIPEFKLRIIEDEKVLYIFDIRVGKNTERYLATIDKTIDIRTKSGSGKVIRVEKDPDFIDPVSGNKYRLTTRDDGNKTKMPIIPWLEPKINGQRHGQMIHPTTNPKTLGHAVSNGCIGTSESAAWIIYYHAPIGTIVHIRYDRFIADPHGDQVILPDIYDSNN